MREDRRRADGGHRGGRRPTPPPDPASGLAPVPAAALDWRRSLARLAGAFADSTLRAYRADMAGFAVWCQALGRPALPAAPELLARYLTEVLAGRRAPATIRRRMAGIRKIHGLLRLPDPTADPEVALALRRALRLSGRRPRQAPGLTAPLRDQLIAACPPTLRGVRDQALLAVGYDLLARPSELVGLLVEDLEPQGSGGARIPIRRAKNDPLARGRYGYLSPKACARLQAWLDAAGLRAGPIFRGVYHGDGLAPRALRPLAVSCALKRAGERAGLEPAFAARLSGHSMRVGPAQDLVVAGRSLPQIMLAGRWTNLNAVAAYAREAELNIWAASP
jgi:integrase